ncbi:MAG: energy transducer TonB [Tannerella sp.]|jgi:TonB family protein|nr:energy transducer TonB [Tannerella sp.]
MKFNKDDISALAGTVLVHLALFLILYYAFIKTTVPSEDSGILVNFGDMYTAVGTFEPQYTPPTIPKEIPPQPQPKPAPSGEELITQDQEETVAIPDSRKKKDEERIADEKARKEREERELKRIEEEENRRRREEELRKKEEAISNRVSNAFGSASSQQTQQGDASPEKGNQGNPFGNSDTGANQGMGGFGTFNLNGRYIGQGGLPRPMDNGQEEGKIVINITVDPDGNVIFAEIGRGTNIDNALMRKSALDAAKRAKFNKIKDTDNQNGTITYIYKLK